MAMNTSPVFPHGVNIGIAELDNADSTDKVTLFTAAADGSRIRSISITSDDSSDRNVKLWITTGGSDYCIGLIPVPDGSGTNGTDSAVDGLNPTHLPWLRENSIVMETGEVLKASMVVAITNGKVIHIRVEGGDY